MRNSPIVFIRKQTRFFKQVSHIFLEVFQGILLFYFRYKNKKEAVFQTGKVTSE